MVRSELYARLGSIAGALVRLLFLVVGGLAADAVRGVITRAGRPVTPSR